MTIFDPPIRDIIARAKEYCRDSHGAEYDLMRDLIYLAEKFKHEFKMLQSGASRLNDNNMTQIQSLELQVKELRKILEQIADTDSRGNRSVGLVNAFNVLKKYPKQKE
jgi:hypothetical protein